MNDLMPILCGIAPLLALLALGVLNYVLVTIHERTYDPSEIDVTAMSDPEIQISIVNGNIRNAVQRYQQLASVNSTKAHHAIDYVIRTPDFIPFNVDIGEHINRGAMSDPEVQISLTNGNISNAVRRYRQLSNVTEKEAQVAVDYVLAHPDFLTAKKKPAAPLTDEGIRELIREGNRDEAIRTYQLFTGVSEADALIEIERLSWEESHQND